MSRSENKSKKPVRALCYYGELDYFKINEFANAEADLKKAG
jgi:hypothetical protein